MLSNISVYGLGYVGTVLFGCLAREGHKVIGVDVDPVKLELIQSGKSPVVEGGMDDLISKAINCDGVEVTSDAAHGVDESDVSFVCVGTPSLENGGQDLTAIKRVAERIGKALKSKQKYHVIVIRSTVIPGTVEKEILPILENYSGKKIGEFGLCFQPEFLREGSSIADYDNPPFTVVGGDSERSVKIIKDIFSHLPCEFISTSIPVAEMMKYCCNIFHGLKITFANEIGRVCQSFSIDSREVMDIVCKDTILNISKAYMKPGFAFGGSCLPKDTRGLLYAAKMRDVDLPVLKSILPSNQIHVDNAVDMVLRTGKRKIGFIGLSFKGGTDDLRESPLVTMAERLIGKGLQLKIYDSKVNLSRLIGANRKFIDEVIPHIGSLMCESAEEVIDLSEVVIIAQNDEVGLLKLYADGSMEQSILDLLGVVDQNKVKGKYQGICW